MILTPAILEVPLRTDQDGVIRIGKTRVTLLTIVARHQAGDAPEDIHRAFPTVYLADIYAVLAYYLAHREEVDNYQRQVEQEGNDLRTKFEALPTYQPLTREMLRKRLEEKGETQE